MDANKVIQARKKLKALPLEKKIALASRSAPDLLMVLLDEKQGPVIQAALNNPHLNPDHIQRMVQNPSTPAEVLEAISQKKEWIRPYRVQMELIKNPHTPISIAIEFVRVMGLTELTSLLGAQGLQPGLRQRMFDLFRQKISQLGEVHRASLLDRVPSDAAQIIIELGGEQVLTTAIRNNHLRQHQAIRIARSSQSTPKILTLLFETPPWGQQYEVRWTLINNDNTPNDVRLKIHRTLTQADKKRLKQNKKLRLHG